MQAGQQTDLAQETRLPPHGGLHGWTANDPDLAAELADSADLVIEPYILDQETPAGTLDFLGLGVPLQGLDPGIVVD